MPTKQILEQRTAGDAHGGASWRTTDQSVREQLHYLRESREKNHHEREMSFLRHLMLYGNSDERQDLEGKLDAAERNERCARRAVWLMALLTGMALAGLGYSAVMLEDFPANKSQVIIRIFCAVGLASVVSFLAFVGFWIVSRAAIDDHREKCRSLVTRIIESRLGKPQGNS